MEKLLLFIKHRLGILWYLIEGINSILFTLFYRPALRKVLPTVFSDHEHGAYIYRLLNSGDTEKLFGLIQKQPPEDLTFFNPHLFDMRSIKKQLKKGSFLMMGTFKQDEMIGYFFLRFFINRKCFVGRLIDRDYRGQGIGEVMNSIMYETAWGLRFRCLSTISRSNKSVMKAHSRNSHMIVLKELKNEYILVEFVPVKEPQVV